MSVVFLLGPSQWDDTARRPRPTGDPMATRRDLAAILRRAGHSVILMEDEPEAPPPAGAEPGPEGPRELMTEKFYRLAARATDVIVYWPARAKMATTYDELLLLVARRRQLAPAPAVWLLHHVSVAAVSRGELRLKEPGGRSRYLGDAAALGVRLLEWVDEVDLFSQTHLLATVQLPRTVEVKVPLRLDVDAPRDAPAQTRETDGREAP